MRIGELARAVGVSPDTLRHYERKGLLEPIRTEGNYREYDAGAQARIRLVRRALRLGFSLDELAQLLGQRDAGGAPCRRVRDLAARKLGDLDLRIGELQALRQELANLVVDWDARLAGVAEGERAYLLDTLPREEKR
jgi:DNA-binding transcriptional MerR regulator